jgi:hypothetical protein
MRCDRCGELEGLYREGALYRAGLFGAEVPWFCEDCMRETGQGANLERIQRRTMNRTFSEQVMEGVEAIKPLLAGKAPELQSAILADLTSTWLCGMVVLGDKEGTRQARDWALSAYIELVVNLTESGVNEPRGGNN